LNKHDSFAAAVRAGGPKKAAVDSGSASPQAAAQAAATPGPVGELFDDLVAVKEPAVSLITGADEATRMGITPLKPIDTSGLHRLPPSDVPAFSLEAELAKVAPVEQAEAIALKDKNLALTLQAASLLPDGHPSKDGLLKDAEDLKTAIARLKKKAPGDALMIEQLRLARQEHVGHAALLAQRAQVGRDSAAEKKAEHVGIIDKMIADLTKLKTNIVTSFDKSTAAWATYHGKRDEQWKGILDEIDARIATIQARPPAPDPAPAPMLVDAAQGQNAQAAQTEDLLQKALNDAKEAQDKVIALQAAFAQEKRNRAAAAAMCSDHLATFTCEAADFPTTVSAPGEDQWQELHNLWAGLEAMQRQEAFQGVQAPVTYGQLLSGTAVPRIILGEALWKKAYPDKQPDDSTIVTVQIRAMLWSSLQAHREKLTADQRRQEEAKASLETAVENVVTEFRHKRRRAGEDGLGVAAAPVPAPAAPVVG